MKCTECDKEVATGHCTACQYCMQDGLTDKVCNTCKAEGNAGFVCAVCINEVVCPECGHLVRREKADDVLMCDFCFAVLEEVHQKTPAPFIDRDGQVSTF